MRWLFVALFFLPSYGFSKDPISVVSSEWASYANRDGSGIYFDLLREVFPDKKLNISIMPFTRAKSVFNNQRADIIVGVYREDVNLAFFPKWPVDRENPIVAIYDGKKHKIESPTDLSDLHLSWIRGYNFDNFFILKQSNYEVNNHTTAMNLLEKGRIDVFMDYEYNVPVDQKNEFTFTKMVPSKFLYIAFQNTEKGQLLASQFDSTMTRIRQSGRLQEIYGELYEVSELDAITPDKHKIVFLTRNPSFSAKRQYSIDNSRYAQEVDFVLRQMQDFDIEEQYAPYVAEKEIMLSHVDTCSFDKIKTEERKKQFIFSRPVGLTLGQKVFYNKELKVNLPNTNPSLRDLIDANPTAKIAVVKGRSYGETLDKQLATVPQNNIFYIPDSMPQYATIDVLMHNTAQFTIEYPTTVNKFNQSHYPLLSVRSLNIANADKYILGHVMCSQSKVTKLFINRINKRLPSVFNDPEFFQLTSSDVLPSNLEEFRQYFNAEFETEH